MTRLVAGAWLLAVAAFLVAAGIALIRIRIRPA